MTVPVLTSEGFEGIQTIVRGRRLPPVLWTMFMLMTLAVLTVTLACQRDQFDQGSGDPSYAQFFDDASQVETMSSKLDRLSPDQLLRFRRDVKRIQPIVDKHAVRLLSHPNASGLSVWFLYDRDGQFSDEVGILLSVTEKVSNGSIPEQQRVPATLDGVRVQIHQRPMGRYY